MEAVFRYLDTILLDPPPLHPCARICYSPFSSLYLSSCEGDIVSVGTVAHEESREANTTSARTWYHFLNVMRQVYGTISNDIRDGAMLLLGLAYTRGSTLFRSGTDVVQL